MWWLLHDPKLETDECGGCYTTRSARQKSVVAVTRTASRYRRVLVAVTRPAARDRRVWWLLHDLQHETEEFGGCYTTCSTRRKSVVAVTRPAARGQKSVVAVTRPAARDRRVWWRRASKGRSVSKARLCKVERACIMATTWTDRRYVLGPPEPAFCAACITNVLRMRP